MGRELAERYAVAGAVFEEADRTLGFSLSALCFHGPEEQLKLTEHTQPAILTCSVACFRVLESHGVLPEYVAGHSLGEYSALVAAGALGFADALQTVRNRGRYMQEAVPVGTGAMAAVTRLPLAALEEVCQEAAQGEVVSPAKHQLTGADHDLRPRRRRAPCCGISPAARRQARAAAAGERPVPLRADEAGAGTAGRRPRQVANSRPALLPDKQPGSPGNSHRRGSPGRADRPGLGAGAVGAIHAQADFAGRQAVRRSGPLARYFPACCGRSIRRWLPSRSRTPPAWKPHWKVCGPSKQRQEARRGDRQSSPGHLYERSGGLHRWPRHSCLSLWNTRRVMKGRVAFVTGASQGIGRACARALGEAGARLVLAARQPTETG